MAIKYHLGCGSKYLQGYTNVDFPGTEHTTITIKADIYCNLLDLKYELCDEIRSHHVFEHFNFPESIALLIKWTQALILGGKLRIDVPDIGILFQETINTLSSRDIPRLFKLIRLIYGSHEAAWAYHINGWTEDSMNYVMSSFGMNLISARRYGNAKSQFPNCGLDMIFEKIKDMPNLENIGKEILGMYAEPCEKALLGVYTSELERLICEN